MRTSILAMIVVAGSAIAFPATAQQQQAAPSEQTSKQIHRDVDEQLKTREQMQRDADKGGRLAIKKSLALMPILRARKVSRRRVRVARLAPRKNNR